VCVCVCVSVSVCVFACMKMSMYSRMHTQVLGWSGMLHCVCTCIQVMVMCESWCAQQLSVRVLLPGWCSPGEGVRRSGWASPPRCPLGRLQGGWTSLECDVDRAQHRTRDVKHTDIRVLWHTISQYAWWTVSHISIGLQVWDQIRHLRLLCVLLMA